MKTRYIVILAASALMALGCTQENTPSTGEAARQYLNLWMAKYHPGVNQSADGLYYLEDKAGNGDLWNKETPYSYVSYTIRSLDGTISATTEEKVAQQLGTYVFGNYYGPKYMATGESNSYAGVDALLTGMRTGGTRTAVIPSWMLTSSRYNSQQEYIDAATSASHLIYTVSLFGQCEDLEQMEKDSVAAYVHRHYGIVEPVSYKEDTDPDGTFYFITDVSAFENKEDIKERTETATGTINYTGRLLNGQVFDTTIEKVAKDAGIYSASKTYSPASVTFASTASSITLNSSSAISGFQGCLFLMKYAGQKATVIFTSSQGYSSTGSGDAIPGWSPLLFEIELVTVDV